MFGYALFAIVVIIQPIAQLLEKYGITQIGTINSVNDLFNLHTIKQIVTSPYIMGGVALSACGLFLWIAVLSHFKLNHIYPFGAISYIVLAILAFFFLHEPITVMRGIGICVIVAGCVLINL